MDNKNYFRFWRILLLILIGIIVADFLLSMTSGSVGHFFENHLPAMVAGGFILVLACIRVNYFSYEDEYEIIHIRSRSLLFGSLENRQETTYEFPKRIITDFKFKRNFFRKKLTIKLLTQNGTQKIQKFNLTFVPICKLKNVLSSLEKIRRTNRAGKVMSDVV